MKTFDEFWPFYLGEHSQPLNRVLHFVGSTVGAVMLLYGLATQRWALLPASLVSGYGFAWFGHFVIEGNKPATFQHPLWSFRGDWKMYALMLTGKLPGELSRLSITPKAQA